jgi:hypothetical protein
MHVGTLLATASQPRLQMTGDRSRCLIVPNCSISPKSLINPK